VQRGLKHDHKRPVEAVTDLPESALHHQSLLHIYAFV